MIWGIAVLIRNLEGSELGKGLVLMGGSRPAAESIGLNTLRFRILALVLGAAIASIAGSLLAFSRGLVLPDSFHLELAFLILFIPLLGGKKTPWGCLLGAAVLVYVLEIVRSFGPGKLLYGLSVLACVLAIPGGIAGTLGALVSIAERWLGLHAPSFVPPSPEISKATDVQAKVSQPKTNQDKAHKTQNEIDDRHGSAPGPAPLIVKNLNKAYGGVRALQDVSFDLLKSEILDVVGPNGAGKTTLIDVLTGIQTADSGRILLQGRILEGPASERSLTGFARTFQHPQLSAELTVGENLGLGLLRLNTPRSWAGMTTFMMRSLLTSPWKRKTRGHDAGVVRETATGVGLHDLNEKMANASFGTEKLAEIGRALVSKPSVLLIDEPFAGLGKSEIDGVIGAIEKWRLHTLGVIVVDHNIDLLSKICDRLLVLDSGVAIACGPANEVLAEAHVQKAYFGGD